MPTLIHRTNGVLREPWLIDENQLVELDELLERAWSNLEGARARELELARDERRRELRAKFPSWGEQEIEDQLSAYSSFALDSSNRSCIFWLEGGARIEASSFKELIRRQEPRDKKVTQVSARLISGKRSLRLSSESWVGGIRIEASPDIDEMAQGWFVELMRWKERIECSKWVSFWKEWGVLTCLTVVWLPLMLLIATFSVGEANSGWQPEAWHLLEDGLEPHEEGRALEILLASQFGYPRPISSARAPRPLSPLALQIRIISVALLIACLVLLLPPRNTIGVGVGAPRLRFYRRWIRWWTVAIPGALFASLVAEPVLSWLRQVL